MYVKGRVWLSAQICFVSKWFWIVRPRSGAGIYNMNEPQCDPTRAFIRPDCTKSNTHEMPHARPRHGSVVRMHCGLGLPHLLAFEPLHPSRLIGGVWDMLLFLAHAIGFRACGFAIALNSV